MSSDRLALHGGTPIRTEPFTPRHPFGQREIVLLTEAIESQTLFAPQSDMLRRFEGAVSELYGVKYTVSATSGTAALHLAVGAVGLNPGDEVITAPITDMGTIIPILYQNAVPIFADTMPGGLGMDPDDVRRKITSRTRAIILVHLTGNPIEVEPFLEIAREHDLVLIEDCCQAHATELRGRYVGTYGHIGCFSMQQSKHVTTGDGGFCITDDPELADKMRLFSDKGWLRTKVSDARVYSTLAMNYRMTALQAAVGLAQIEKVVAVVGRRNALGDRLSDLIRDIPGVEPAQVTDGAKHSYWFYPLIVQDWQAGPFAQALQAEGIPAGAGYIGKPIFLCNEVLHQGRTYGNTSFPFGSPYTDRRYEELYAPGVCPHCEDILEHLVVLTIHEHTTDSESVDIARAIHKVANGLQVGDVTA